MLSEFHSLAEVFGYARAREHLKPKLLDDGEIGHVGDYVLLGTTCGLALTDSVLCE